MLTGAATELYQKILKIVPNAYLIASGGISSMADILELQEAGIPAVITGKAIYEGRITMDEIRNFIN
jgi:phosphoribosylformimino-5-aminoimidazole carboxamide ribotide isomerase